MGRPCKLGDGGMVEQGYLGRTYLGQEGESGEHLKQQRGLRGLVSLPGPFHELASFLHPNSGRLSTFLSGFLESRC